MDIDKEKDFSEWYNTILKEAELCDLRYNLKGFMVIPPNAAKVMRLMYREYEDALERKGHSPAYFPSLIPERNLKAESSHIEGFIPEVFWVTEGGKAGKLEERMALRPTSETAMYPMYALWINGRKDLPLKVYQSCQVWRHETKATKPFIRTREFYWIEAHDCFATEEGAFEQVKEDMETTEEIIHNSFGIPFMFFKRPQWDKFPGADDTYAADTMLPDGRVLQLPSTHMLGQNFAKVFGVKFMDDDEKERYVWQTTYGPAISRIFAALISIHGDSKGLVLPFNLAPAQIVIIPIFRKEGMEEVLAYARDVEEKLKEKYRVKLDDSGESPGYKFNQWEMLGVPIRIEVGKRELDENAVVLVRRDTGEKKKLPVEALEEEVAVAGEDLNENIGKLADEKFGKRLASADTAEELYSLVKDGMLVKAPFCTDQMEGEHCAEKIKDESTGNVRGSLFGETEKPKEKKCVVCGKPANHYLYVARQY